MTVNSAIYRRRSLGANRIMLVKFFQDSSRKHAISRPVVKKDDFNVDPSCYIVTCIIAMHRQ